MKNKQGKSQMEEVFFNINNGYVEAVTRGYINGLLNKSQYVNLTQCDNLEDLKLQLSATDYGNFLASYAGKLTTSVIQENLSKKLYQQFNYLKMQSSGTLTKILDYISFGYMIDNVSLMITGTLHERNSTEILAKCNPLGFFETLPTLSVATDMESLYNTVLIDTPLAPFFKNCLSIEDLDDLNIEIIRNRLYKNYLESFVQFVEVNLAISDKDIMTNLLRLDSDKRVINISLNSLNNPDLSAEQKLSLFPSYGKLYPNYHNELAEIEDVEQLRGILQNVPEYAGFFSDQESEDSRGIEDWFYHLEMTYCKDIFTQQFTFSTIWGWLRVKEQEVRNITWIAECITQNQRNRIDNYISVL